MNPTYESVLIDIWDEVFSQRDVHVCLMTREAAVFDSLLDLLEKNMRCDGILGKPESYPTALLVDIWDMAFEGLCMVPPGDMQQHDKDICNRINYYWHSQLLEVEHILKKRPGFCGMM